MSDVETLFSNAAIARVPKGALVFHRDAPVRDAVFLQTGSVALVRTLKEGEALTLHWAQGPALLAEASLFAERYHCDGVARTDVVLRRIRRAALLAALRDDPALVLSLLAGMAGDLQAQRAQTEILRMKRLSDRLDAWLALHGPPESGGWTHVAAAIGVTPAALYRERARRRNGI